MRIELAQQIEKLVMPVTEIYFVSTFFKRGVNLFLNAFELILKSEVVVELGLHLVTLGKLRKHEVKKGYKAILTVA